MTTSTRCIGCHEALEPARRGLGYCGKTCRRVADVVGKARELDASAKAAQKEHGLTDDVRAMHEAADAKFHAAFELGKKIREAKSVDR